MQYVEVDKGCWLWKGAILKTGYGAFDRGPLKSHRVSFELFRGKIPKGKFVCHSCDMPSCVNPGHLWAGTNSENILDAIKKGRKKPMRGTLNGMCKLTPLAVLAIRDLAKQDSWSQARIAEKFSISQTQISRIVRGKRWKD
jgi:hypothetical protein